MTERSDKLRARAQRMGKLGQDLTHQAHQMSEVIPFGQPMLVDHYSYKSDRNYRERIGNKMRRGIRLMAEASAMLEQAERIERSQVIFSDDPAAEEKLAERIAQLTERQAVMVQANEIIRKATSEPALVDALGALGFDLDMIDRVLHPVMGRPGFQTFQLSNNSANIRRLRDRLEQIERVAARGKLPDVVVDGVVIADDLELDRITVRFPARPPREISQAMKHAGFRWSPTNACYMAYRTHAQIYMNRAAKIAEGMPK